MVMVVVGLLAGTWKVSVVACHTRSAICVVRSGRGVAHAGAYVRTLVSRACLQKHHVVAGPMAAVVVVVVVVVVLG